MQALCEHRAHGKGHSNAHFRIPHSATDIQGVYHYGAILSSASVAGGSDYVSELRELQSGAYESDSSGGHSAGFSGVPEKVLRVASALSSGSSHMLSVRWSLPHLLLPFLLFIRHLDICSELWLLGGGAEVTVYLTFGRDI